MKRHLNTLYIFTQGTYVAKEGQTLVLRLKDKIVSRFPIHNIGGIIAFGNVLFSPYALELCAKLNVAVSFLSTTGRFYASVSGPISGNVLLRREQYRQADNPVASANLAKCFIMGKIVNARCLILRTLRDHASIVNCKQIETLSLRLNHYCDQLERETDLDSLRGIEGEAAREYFSVFSELIIAQKESFTFDERSKRPPRDCTNAVLSFIYTVLMHDIRSAIETVGLDAQVGFLHRDRPGRYGLALDLMEEFRTAFADRFVLTLINRKQITENSFQKSETGAVLLNEKGKKEVVVAYQKRKQEEIMHPYINEKVTIGVLFFIQAQLLARFLRGDIDGYPPFIWK